MLGLLYPAYQKFYSALCCLERFDKESNFFDNISAIDNFFNEYRNVTFVLQSSLKHTEYFEAYIKNRDKFLTDHWFVEKRNETIKQKPFQLIKEIVITLYLPFGGFTVSEKRFSVENDVPLSSILDNLKKTLREINKYEVYFSVSYNFYETDSDINLLERVLHGITSMKNFMESMEKDIGAMCPLCVQLKEKINNIHFLYVPLDFLLTNDYTYYPEKDHFDKAARTSMILSLNNKKVANHCSLSKLIQSKHFNYDGTAFGSFTLMHATLRSIHPGMDIMPAIMVIYDDGTYDLDAFHATMKTTVYRKLTETARLVYEQNVVEVCYSSLYSNIPFTLNIPKTSRERIQQFTSDILVCASIDKHLNEKEYVFDGKHMENIEYVACVMRNELCEHLSICDINLFPIRCAFEKKLNGSSN